MYAYRPPYMAGQKQDDQLEHTFSSSVRIQDVALMTYQRRSTIGRGGERGSRISVLMVRHDNDDIYIYAYTHAHTNTYTHTHTYIHIYIYLNVCIYAHTHMNLCISIKVFTHTHTHKYKYIYVRPTVNFSLFMNYFLLRKFFSKFKK